MKYGLLFLSMALVSTAASAQIGVSLYPQTAPIPADEYVFYTLTVWNAGQAPLQNAEVEVILPDRIDSFYPSSLQCNGICSDLETATWSLGTLGVGESRSTIYWTTIEGTAPDGFILESFVTASADDVSDATFTSQVEVDTPALPLAFSLSPHRAVPGDTIRATLTIGTTDTTPREQVLARLEWPRGFTFAEGSAGFTRESSGAVSWDIGQLQPNQGASASATLIVDSDADPQTPLQLTATTSDAFAPDSSSVATQIIPVKETSGLVLSISDNSDGDTNEDETVRYTLTATNEGTIPIPDITVGVLLPDRIDSFNAPSGTSCPGVCADAERMIWDVGGLLPGVSQTLAFNVTTEGSVPLGFIHETILEAVNPSGRITGTEYAVLVGDLVSFPSPVATEATPNSNQLEVQVAPNPATLTTTLSAYSNAAEPYRLDMFDLTGRRLWSSAGIFETTGEVSVALSVAHLPSGLYLIRLSTDTARVTTNVVIVR